MKNKLFKISKDSFKNSLCVKNAPSCDLLLTLTVLLLALFGTVMVFSAGYAYAYARYDDGFYFIKRQIIWIILGLIAMYAASHVKPKLYEGITPIIYTVTLILLILVLIIGMVEIQRFAPFPTIPMIRTRISNIKVTV